MQCDTGSRNEGCRNIGFDKAEQNGQPRARIVNLLKMMLSDDFHFANLSPQSFSSGALLCCFREGAGREDRECAHSQTGNKLSK